MRQASLFPSIDEIFLQISEKLSDWWGVIFDPLWLWYFALFLFFLALCVIGYFLPFKIVRASLGGGLLLAIAFVFGGKVMHDQMKKTVDAERVKRRAAEERAKSRVNTSNGGDGGGGFRWPF